MGKNLFHKMKNVIPSHTICKPQPDLNNCESYGPVNKKKPRELKLDSEGSHIWE